MCNSDCNPFCHARRCERCYHWELVPGLVEGMDNAGECRREPTKKFPTKSNETCILFKVRETVQCGTCGHWDEIEGSDNKVLLGVTDGYCVQGDQATPTYSIGSCHKYTPHQTRK